MQASTSQDFWLSMSFTRVALRASQRLAAHAASEAGPSCPSAVAQQRACSSKAACESTPSSQRET